MRVTDGLRSLFGKLGDPSRDKSAGLYHADSYVSDHQLLAAYRSDWISKKIVDIPADDALRKWRVWGGEHRDAIEREERRLGMRHKVSEAVTKGRLLGGAAIYIGTNQDPADPLDINAVGRGGVEYLTVLTRRELVAGEIERDPFSAYYGKPRDYRISGEKASATIHPSRLAIFGGDASADLWSTTGGARGWSESVLIATDAIVKQALGTFQNTASLLHEANVDVIAVPDLAASLSTPEGESVLLNRFSVAAAAKGITGMLILDSSEEYNRRSASFANLPELMEAFARFCAAAADIPATRFLAQSPSGLIATGESDMDNYFNKIAAIQTLEIEPALVNADACLVRSALGDYPDDVGFEWSPLKQMDEKELAEIGKVTCESIKILSELSEGGAFLPREIRELAVHRLGEIGAFPHLRDVIAETARLLEMEPELDAPPEPDAAP